MSDRQQSFDLSTTPIHRVLIRALIDGWTGLIVAQRDTIKTIIMIDHGHPRACRSNVTDEGLGNLLVAQSLITRNEVEKVAAESKSTDGFPLGAALVHRQLLQPGDLSRVLEQQLVLRLHNLLTWSDGVAQFREQQNDTNQYVQMGRPTAAVILEGVINAGKNSGAIQSFDQELCLILEGGGAIAIDQLQLKGQELSFLRALKGVSPLSDVLSKTKLDAERALALAYGIHAIGLLDVIQSAGVVKENDPTQVHRASAPATPSKDTSPTAKKILEMVEGMSEKNHFDLLGIDQQTDEAETRKIYFSLAKEFHPDKLRVISDPHVREQGEILFARITEAFQVLTDATKRENYLAELDYGGDDATEEAVKILESEALFQRGRSYLKQGEFRGAKKVLDEAVSLHPDESEYRLYLGWANYKVAAASKNAEAMEEAKKMIESYKDARPKLEVGYLYLGQIYKLEGDRDRAKRQFDRAIEINRDCHEAYRELRLLEMRGEKKKGLKGLFGKK